MSTSEQIKAVITDSKRPIYFQDVPIDLTNTELRVFVYSVDGGAEVEVTKGVQYGAASNAETSIDVDFTDRNLVPGAYFLNIKTPELTIVVNVLILFGPDGKTFNTYGDSGTTQLSVMTDEQGNVMTDDQGNVLIA